MKACKSVVDPKPGNMWVIWDVAGLRFKRVKRVTQDDLDRNFVYEMSGRDFEVWGRGNEE